MIGRWFKEKLLTKLDSNRGSGEVVILITVFLIVYVLIPVFAVVMEKQLFYLRASDIRESMELASVSTYNTMSNTNLAKTSINFNSDKTLTVFKSFLAKNLHINSDLTPKPQGCIPKGTVVVNSLSIHLSGFPKNCESGKALTRPTVHAVVTVPIKPTLYQYTILQLLGVSTINCVVHTDVDLPLNR